MDELINKLQGKSIETQITLIERFINSCSNIDWTLRADKLLRAKKEEKRQKDQKQKETESAALEPTKTPTEKNSLIGLMNKLEILIAIDKHHEALLLADNIMRNYYWQMNDSEQQRLKEILAKLHQTTKVARSTDSNTPTMILLKKMRILLADPPSLSEARTTADTIRDKHYEYLSTEEVSEFITMLKDLAQKESFHEQKEQRIRALEDDNKNLNQKIRHIQEANQRLDEQNKQLQEALSNYHPEAEVKYKKLIACVLAYIYRANPVVLPNYKLIHLTLEQYRNKSPKGCNPALLISIVEAILDDFEACTRFFEKIDMYTM